MFDFKFEVFYFEFI